jgi:hypothetical protein
VALGLVLSDAAPAVAACHHFTVSASPNPVAEGSALTVTVSRDANVAPSHVDVSTIDETAKAGQDFQPLSRTVSFTNDIKQSFPVSIISHATSEPARTFRLHLSNPGGCAVNPNFVLDPDVRVTIGANGVPAPSAATAPKATPAATAGTRATSPPATSAAATTAPTTTSTSSSEPTTTGSSTSSTSLAGQAPRATKHGGGSVGIVVVLAALAALALAGGGFLLYRRRTG